MKTAIFGFSSSGKTELFLALAGPEKHNTNQAMVKVPEPRLAPLSKLFKPKKTTPAEIEYLDIPGTGQDQGLGQRVLNEIRPYDCLLAVLDAYSGFSDPNEQFQDIEADLLISDLAVLENRLQRIEQDKKKDKHLVSPNEEDLLLKAKDVLEKEEPLRTRPELAQAKELRGFTLLTAKPILYVWNISEQDLDFQDTPKDSSGCSHIAVSAKLEKELAEFEDPDAREEFLQDLGLKESALDRIISKTYNLMGLITFLTAGEKEVRAWTVTQGSSAPQAAGVIHTDLQKGFIRAEVLAWSDFEMCQSFKTAKEKGLLRLEGKDYQVKDGDIITFRFNV